MVKISYIEVTARPEYPIMGKPRLHLWEVTLQTLQRQTMKDFEYIVVDVFYDERPDYFVDHNYGIRIKHVPTTPNIWHDLGIVQACHQQNKGIIHADGELLFTNGDSYMYPPDFMENLWRHYQDGYFVSSAFGADVTYGPKLYLDIARKNVVPTDWYSFLHFHGWVNMDHRFNMLFEGTDKQMSMIPPSWYFGISSLSLEAALKVNGFDEAFDGDRMLSDCDMGIRLAMAGYKLAMFKDTYTIEAYANPDWHPKMRTPIPMIKCNYALLKYNQLMNRYRVNDPLLDSDIEWMIKNICLGGLCEQSVDCRKKHPHAFPFFDKTSKELYEYWKEHLPSLKIDLGLEREMRIDAENYKDGTFVNV